MTLQELLEIHEKLLTVESCESFLEKLESLPMNGELADTIRVLSIVSPVIHGDPNGYRGQAIFWTGKKNISIWDYEQIPSSH